MRICLISYEFLPKTGFGGVAALYTDLSTALKRLGHDVTVLSGNDRRATTINRDRGYTNVQFGYRRLKPRPLECAARTAQVLYHYRRAESTYGRFDVVESPELQAEPLLINLIRKDAPVITRLVTPHYLFYSMNERRPLRTVDWLERANANHSSLILGDARRWAENILETWRIDKSKLRICPLGIDLERIDDVREAPVEISSPYVLFAGRLTIAKGPQVLSSAAAEILSFHPKLKIVFAGADTLTRSGQSVRDLVTNAAPKEFRDSLVFTGFVKSWEELVNLYRHAEVCVKADSFANHSYDTMGQMACGRPLVCTNNEAYADMIMSGENGYLFERDDPHQLATLIGRLVSDPAMATRMGNQARKTIEARFTSEICASETVRYYNEVVSRAKSDQ